MSAQIRAEVKSAGLLALANILSKVFGFVREVAIAYFFGASPLLASYITLRSISDVFTTFSGGAALEAVLLPRLTRQFASDKPASLERFEIDARQIGKVVALASLALTIPYIALRAGDFTRVELAQLVGVAIIMSLSLGWLFLLSVGLLVLQARGRFARYAVLSSLVDCSMALLTIPSALLGVLGLALSRLVSIGLVLPTCWREARISRHLTANGSVNELRLSLRDFDVPTLVAGNFSVVILLGSRIVAGLGGGTSVAHLAYATIVLNSVMTVLIRSMSTVLLRNFSISAERDKVTWSALAALACGAFVVALAYLSGEELISLIYMRGAFSMEDASATAYMFKVLSVPFALQFVSTILLQPMFAAMHAAARWVRKAVTAICLGTFFLALAVALVSPSSAGDAALFMITATSFLILFVSVGGYMAHAELPVSRT